MSPVATPFLEMSQAIIEAGGEALKKCYQCGTCTGTCPWTPITHFNIRMLVRLSQLGPGGHGREYVELFNLQIFAWTDAPAGWKSLILVRAIRKRLQRGWQTAAESCALFVGSMSARGNPWSGDEDKRNAWAREQYPLFTEDKEYLNWTCCTSCYDPRNTRVAKGNSNDSERCRLKLGIASDSGPVLW